MNNKTTIAKIKEFFNTIYSLTLFTIKSFYIIISEDMKREAREQRQKKKKE